MTTIDTKFRKGVPVSDRDVSAERFDFQIKDMEPEDGTVFERAKDVVAQIRGREKAEAYLRSITGDGGDPIEDVMLASLEPGPPPPKPELGFRDDAQAACLYKGALNMVFGRDGHGKTVYATVLAARAIAAGIKVLWLTNEMSPEEVESRMEEQGVTRAQLSQFFVRGPMESITYDGPEGIKERLSNLIQDHEIGLSVFDSGSREVSNLGKDSFRDDDVLSVLGPIESVMIETGTAGLAIGHTGQDAKLWRPSGARAWMRLQGAYLMAVAGTPALAPARDGHSRIVLIKDNKGGILKQGFALKECLTEITSVKGSTRCELRAPTRMQMQVEQAETHDFAREMMAWIFRENRDGRFPTTREVLDSCTGEDRVLSGLLKWWSKNLWVAREKDGKALRHRVTDQGVTVLEDPDGVFGEGNGEDL